MKKLIIKTIIVLAGVFAIDSLVGILGDWLIHKGAEKSYAGQTALLNYSLNGVNADIVILGSSEASSAYIPSIISEQLYARTGQMYSVFNAGTYFQGLPFCYCVEQGLVGRSNPKIIVLDLVPNYLYPADYSSMTPQLRPYSRVNPYVKQLLALHDEANERIKSRCNMYRWNSEIIKLSSILYEHNTSDGFDPHSGTLPANSQKKEEQFTEKGLSEIAINEFEGLIELAEKNNIILVCTVSPKYRILPLHSDSYRTMMDILNEHNIPVLEYNNDSSFDNPLLFHDPAHLNPEGAKMCTSILVELLVSFL